MRLLIIRKNMLTDTILQSTELKKELHRDQIKETVLIEVYTRL